MTALTDLMATDSIDRLNSEAGSLDPCLSVCHECDLLNRVPALPPDRAARCLRCGHVLFRNPANCVEKTLSLSVSALILWVVANVFPFLSFGLPGNLVEERVQLAVLITAADQADGLLRHDLPWVPERQRMRVLAARSLRRDGSEVSARQGDTQRLVEPEFNLYYDTRMRVVQ